MRGAKHSVLPNAPAAPCRRTGRSGTALVRGDLAWPSRLANLRRVPVPVQRATGEPTGIAGGPMRLECPIGVLLPTRAPMRQAAPGPRPTTEERRVGQEYGRTRRYR